MADAEAQAAPQPEVIDLDALPERKYLEASGIWIQKDKVEDAIREKYRRVLRVLANGAKPRTPLKQELEDFHIAAAKAASGKVIDRHVHRWGTAIKKAVTEAENELDAADEMVELLKKLGGRQDDINRLRLVRAGASKRYEKASEGQDRAAALIKDLKRHLAGDY